MADAQINWILPTTRREGGALPESEIKHVVVQLSLDGGTNFALVDNIAPPEVSIPVADLDFGDWIVELTVVDTNDQPGAPLNTPFQIKDSSPPGQVTNVTVDLS